MIAFVDLETTGLDPSEDAVLEVACIVTDDRLREVARFERVLGCNYKFENLPERVQQMHTTNGLWLLTQEPGRLYRGQVDQELCEFLDAAGATDAQLGGNTINFDRAFMAVHLPRALAMLHYRNVDVSTLNEVCRRFLKGLYESRPAPQKGHRAMADAEESIATLRHYVGRLGDTNVVGW